MMELSFKVDFDIYVISENVSFRRPCELCLCCGDVNTPKQKGYLISVVPTIGEFPDGWGGVQHWYCHNCLHTVVAPRAIKRDMKALVINS